MGGETSMGAVTTERLLIGGAWVEGGVCFAVEEMTEIKMVVLNL